MVKAKRFLLIGLTIIFSFWSLPITAGMAEEIKLQLPPMPPTIEELTKGKVKIGDLITKDNVDLVKDYLSAGLYQCVRNGMVLEMGKNLPPEQINPWYFLEATEKYKDQAVVNDHWVVTSRDGSPWPGGFPFTEPKTVLEVMGYKRFSHGYDDFEVLQPMYYVNKEGKHYKTAVLKIFRLWTQGRLKIPPLGAVPGMEEQRERFINVFVSPLELKGLGVFNVNHSDDTEHYDIGFTYLPAFKRTIRISAATWQDNVGGSDFTQGDPSGGLREPFSTWDFKLIEKKFMLTGEPVREKQPILLPGGLDVDIQTKWDVGKKYPRVGWVINPVYVIEATPKDKGHIYSKKILYIVAPYFVSTSPDPSPLADIYDRSGGLWKEYVDFKGRKFVHQDGTEYLATLCISMYDLQTGHQSHMVSYSEFNKGISPETINLKTMLKMGR